ncbi:MAG: Hsp20/alpha crystallin family protein [Bacteroidota bacterium]|nr:Hsp20/alpha crystallin family protein [Bacteroidota bacterium]
MMNTMQRRRGLFPGGKFYTGNESRISDCYDVQGCLCKPAANVIENNDSFILELAAPGLTKEDFELKLDKRLLTIKSDFETAELPENAEMIRKEFCYKGFELSFGLPDSAKTDAISASYENGVLKVVIPKLEEAKEKPAREISVS